MDKILYMDNGRGFTYPENSFSLCNSHHTGHKSIGKFGIGGTIAPYFLGKKRPGIDGNMRAELKLDYEEAFSRAQSADSTPTTRIVPGYGRAI